MVARVKRDRGVVNICRVSRVKRCTVGIIYRATRVKRDKGVINICRVSRVKSCMVGIIYRGCEGKVG